MKKEDLIAKAKERGIELSEEQADKYINLSDEELENIAGGVGLCGYEQKVIDVTKAETCSYYRVYDPEIKDRVCNNCGNADLKTQSIFGSNYEVYCTVEKAWQ